MATAWTANTSLSVGNIIAPTSSSSGLFFKVTSAGTTGSSEPSWPSTIGATVFDNNVEYISQSAVFGDLQTLNPSAIIELFEVDLIEGVNYPTGNPQGIETNYKFHAGTNLNAYGNILWAGQSYPRFPVEASGFAFQKGQLPRPKFVVSNKDGFMSSILKEVNKFTPSNDLTGCKVTRIRTLAKFLDAENFPAVSTVTGTTTQTVADPSDVETVTYAVTVVQDSNGDNVFALNGTQKPVITMKRGSTYVFNQSDSSNVGHPLRIRSDAGGYQGVELTGTLGTDATVTYQPVYPSTPSDLRYYCTTHGNAMGNTITINNPNTITQTVDVISTVRQNPFGTPDPNAEFPREVYFIDRKSSENRLTVEFELAAPTDLVNVRIPKRICTRKEFPAIGTFG